MIEPHREGDRAADAWIGETLGCTQIVECVHRGSLACVYRGRQEKRSVAVKIYRLDAPVSERVHREREAQRRVAHACVARLLDGGLAPDGSPYLVSEWVQGMRLEDRFELGPTPWEALHPIFTSIASGLAAIHAVGVVHRDVKPANVMLPAAPEPAAVLLDFGHALVLDQDHLTDRGWTLGTASYMAPEQASGDAIDARCDLYATGVVLYRGLTGSLPFSDPSPAVVLDLHRHEPVTPPRERAPDARISRGAEDLVIWLLAKDPRERVPSAQVLLHALATLGPRRGER